MRILLLKGGQQMSTEELKAKINRALDEVYNKGNLSVVDDTASENLIYALKPDLGDWAGSS